MQHLKKPAPTIKKINHSDWLTIYIGLQKVGYKHTSVTTDKLNGKPVYKRDETVKLVFRQGPIKSEIEVRQTFYADASFNPISAKYSYIAKSFGGSMSNPVYMGTIIESKYKGRTVTST